MVSRVRDIKVQGIAETDGFARISGLFNGLPAARTKFGKQSLGKLAAHYREYLRDYVKDYKGPGPMRNEATMIIGNLRRKQPLVQTRKYLMGLRAKKTSETTHSATWSIGGFDEDIHAPSGLRMSKMLEILDQGNPENLVFGRVPGPIRARPHLKPSFDIWSKTILPKLWNRLALDFWDKYWRGQ